ALEQFPVAHKPLVQAHAGELDHSVVARSVRLSYAMQETPRPAPPKHYCYYSRDTFLGPVATRLPGWFEPGKSGRPPGAPPPGAFPTRGTDDGRGAVRTQ